MQTDKVNQSLPKIVEVNSNDESREFLNMSMQSKGPKAIGSDNQDYIFFDFIKKHRENFIRMSEIKVFYFIEH